jgi:hypothetical protein
MNQQIKETVALAYETALRRFSAFESDADNQKALDAMQKIIVQQSYWLSEYGLRIDTTDVFGKPARGWHPDSIKSAVEAVKAGWYHEGE